MPSNVRTPEDEKLWRHAKTMALAAKGHHDIPAGSANDILSGEDAWGLVQDLFKKLKSGEITKRESTGSVREARRSVLMRGVAKVWESLLSWERASLLQEKLGMNPAHAVHSFPDLESHVQEAVAKALAEDFYDSEDEDDMTAVDDYGMMPSDYSGERAVMLPSDDLSDELPLDDQFDEEVDDFEDEGDFVEVGDDSFDDAGSLPSDFISGPVDPVVPEEYMGSDYDTGYDPASEETFVPVEDGDIDDSGEFEGIDDDDGYEVEDEDEEIDTYEGMMPSDYMESSRDGLAFDATAITETLQEEDASSNLVGEVAYQYNAFLAEGSNGTFLDFWNLTSNHFDWATDGQVMQALAQAQAMGLVTGGVYEQETEPDQSSQLVGEVGYAFKEFNEQGGEGDFLEFFRKTRVKFAWASDEQVKAALSQAKKMKIGEASRSDLATHHYPNWDQEVQRVLSIIPRAVKAAGITVKDVEANAYGDMNVLTFTPSVRIAGYMNIEDQQRTVVLRFAPGFGAKIDDETGAVTPSGIAGPSGAGLDEIEIYPAEINPRFSVRKKYKDLIVAYKFGDWVRFTGSSFRAEGGKRYWYSIFKPLDLKVGRAVGDINVGPLEPLGMGEAEDKKMAAAKKMAANALKKGSDQDKENLAKKFRKTMESYGVAPGDVYIYMRRLKTIVFKGIAPAGWDNRARLLQNSDVLEWEPYFSGGWKPMPVGATFPGVPYSQKEFEIAAMRARKSNIPSDGISINKLLPYPEAYEEGTEKLATKFRKAVKESDDPETGIAAGLISALLEAEADDNPDDKKKKKDGEGDGKDGDDRPPDKEKDGGNSADGDGKKKKDEK